MFKYKIILIILIHKLTQIILNIKINRFKNMKYNRFKT